MERNELIESLEYVISLIRKTIQLNNERANIRNQYRGTIPLQPHYVITRKDNPTLYFGIIGLVTVLLSIPIQVPIGKTGLATTIIPVYVHMLFTAILMLITKIPGISLLGGFIPVLFIAKLTIKPITKFLNKRIDKKNMEISNQNDAIRKHNLRVQEQEQKIVDQLKALQNAFATDVYPWFPQDYLRLEAVEYFLRTVRNSRADTLKETINIYVNDKQHQEQMHALEKQMNMLGTIASNQQETHRLLRVNNMLSTANLVVGMQTRDAVDRNTEAVDRNTDAIHSNTSAVNRIWDRIK